MLQIKNIKKQYQVGEFVQQALCGVSLNLRDSEFVSILGPSGSGKTTLLNVIGGLDQYDQGDLVIGDISTQQYSDKDWDSYRNHTVGFVFQSYNLISHQSILANVELALTISGISKGERKNRAVEALTAVGLKEHIHKKPNQLSGGQMQRVAIARALVNNPRIVLADEPTGALDSDTSVSIMKLLQEVAQDRLVVMVTHNPELAEEYSTRIVSFRDGSIVGDSNPFTPETADLGQENHKNMGKSSMSFGTSVSLSFNNLKSKLGQTLLTSFAGSIGIIGIALILALSNGVNQYIADLQKETMASYPLTISSETFDMASFSPEKPSDRRNSGDEEENRMGIYENMNHLLMEETVKSNIIQNNLKDFKQYLEDPNSAIQPYLGENGVVYSYDLKFDVYVKNSEGKAQNTNDPAEEENSGGPQMMSPMMAMSSMLSSSAEMPENFSQMMPSQGENLINDMVFDSYELLYGEWPTAFDEVVLVLGSNHDISTETLYQLGFLSKEDYTLQKEEISEGNTPDSRIWDYDFVEDTNFYVVPFADYYVEGENGSFSFENEDPVFLDSLLEEAVELRITAVVKPMEDSENDTISTAIAYTSALTDHIIQYTEESPVVLAQEADRDVNILTGFSFEQPTDEAKVEDASQFLSNLPPEEKDSFYSMMLYSSGDPSAMTQPPMQGAESGQALDFWLENQAEDEFLISIYDQYLAGSTYEENLTAFGKANFDTPSAIDIYTDSFEDKEGVSASISDYNATVEEDSQISYTDYVAMLTSSITSIVNVISYVLIAFVSVSLVVSCIMIGIITHISVLERTKEIGILRAIGASKKNISQVFNAETLIIGLFSGSIGVLTTILLTIPINSIIHKLVENNDVNAQLSPHHAMTLVLISVFITVLGGLLPAKKAAKKDPVIALRSE